MHKHLIAVLIGATFLLGLLLGGWVGRSGGVREMQREACMNGLADYDADENGDSQFIWAVPFGEMK